MNPNEYNGQDIFKTGTSISQPQSWFRNIPEQFRQRREDRNAPHVHLTAVPDPSLLKQFARPKTLLGSIRLTSEGILADRGRTIQTTAQPVEVEELWSKGSSGRSGLLSVGLHGLLIGAVLLPTYLVFRTPPMTTTQVTMLQQPIILNMPKTDGKS